MLYPSQTSLIPVTVALTKFLENEGLKAFFENYPYWYLGSTPFRFLTGPVVPILLSGVHKLLPSVSLFTTTIWLVILSVALGAIGWLMLVNKLRVTGYELNKKKFIIHNSIFIILLLVLPWRYLSALTLEEGSSVVAKNLIPFVLISFWNFLGARNIKKGIIATLAVSIALLTNINVLPILIIGISTVIITRSFRKGKIRKIYRYIRQSLLVILLSVVLVTFWYTPSFWLTVLSNPSIGGASGIKVIFRILDLFKILVPIFLAVVAVYFSGRIKDRITVFTLVWTLTFLFLTIFRFIGDPDFWMDWTAWMGEIEVGVALLLVSKLQVPNFKLQTSSKFQITNNKYNAITYVLLLVMLIFPIYFTWRTYLKLGKPVLLSRQSPQGVESLKVLSGIVERDCLPRPCNVFLSGAGVFWLDALYDIYQVRGGKDEVAVDPFWDKAAYELREGTDPQLTKEWLEKLHIDYVLVHTLSSKEYYHDFKSMGKWDELGIRTYEAGGDIIYKIK